MGAGNVVSVGEMGGGRQEGESPSRPPPVPHIGADRLTSLLNVFDVPEPNSDPRTSKWPKVGDPPVRLPARASREASCPLADASEDSVTWWTRKFTSWDWFLITRDVLFTKVEGQSRYTCGNGEERDVFNTFRRVWRDEDLTRGLSVTEAAEDCCSSHSSIVCLTCRANCQASLAVAIGRFEHTSFGRNRID